MLSAQLVDDPALQANVKSRGLVRRAKQTLLLESLILKLAKIMTLLVVFKMLQKRVHRLKTFLLLLCSYLKTVREVVNFWSWAALVADLGSENFNLEGSLSVA